MSVGGREELRQTPLLWKVHVVGKEHHVAGGVSRYGSSPLDCVDDP